MENEPGNAIGAPPKLVIKKPDAATPASPQTIKPGVLPKPTTRSDLQSGAPTAPDGKKKTSRIPLEDASLPPAVQEVLASGEIGPKTIRLKRPPQFASQHISQPIESLINPQPAGEPAVAKKQTSRISLESALMPDESAADGAAPAAGDQMATIKAKRASPGQPTTFALPREAAPTITKSQTSKIEPLPETTQPAPDGQPTQRKTIKIRRPGASGVDSTAQTIPKVRKPVAATGGGDGEESAAGQSYELLTVATAPARPPSKMILVWNIVFSVAGVAAIIVMGILISTLTTQAFPK